MNNSNFNRLSQGLFVVGAVMLIAALYLFLFAESVATLPAASRSGNAWPWPAGPLMIRFAASLIFALGVGAFLAGFRLDYPTLYALGITGIVAGAVLTLHLLVNLGNIDWSKPLAYVWALIGLGMLGVSVLLFQRVRPRMVGVTLPPSPSAANMIAPFICALTGVVGIIMFFLPDLGLRLWPWQLTSPVNAQLLGALFLGVSSLSFISWRQRSWYGFDVLYAAAGTFSLVALLACFIHINLFADKPITSAVFFFTYALGGVLGFYPYFRYVFGQKAKPTPQAA